MIKFGQLFGIHRINEAVIAPIGRPHSTIKLVVVVGGVCKGQGRNQHELMTVTYQEFLVHDQ